MLARKSQNPALKTATCAALLAASLSVPAAADVVSSIERYCTSSWQRAGIPLGDWNDCTQDTLLELLSRLPQDRLSEAIDRPRSGERRELMRSVWCVAQRWRRSARREPVSLETLDSIDGDDCPAVDRREPGDAEALAAAVEHLSGNQRRILKLWSEGNSVAEIATALDLPAARVSDLKYKAIKSLKARLVSETS